MLVQRGNVDGASMPYTMHRLIGFCQHWCGKQIDWFLSMLCHWSLPKVLKTFLMTRYTERHNLNTTLSG